MCKSTKAGCGNSFCAWQSAKRHEPDLNMPVFFIQDDERAQGGLSRLRAVAPAGLSVAVASGVSEVRIGLAAGAKRIRTLGPTRVRRPRQPQGWLLTPRWREMDSNSRSRITKGRRVRRATGGQAVLNVPRGWDRKFESPLLQRRVRNEPSQADAGCRERHYCCWAAFRHWPVVRTELNQRNPQCGGKRPLDVRECGDSGKCFGHSSAARARVALGMALKEPIKHRGREPGSGRY
jgi:hypothetical protein